MELTRVGFAFGGSVCEAEIGGSSEHPIGEMGVFLLLSTLQCSNPSTPSSKVVELTPPWRLLFQSLSCRVLVHSSLPPCVKHCWCSSCYSYLRHIAMRFNVRTNLASQSTGGASLVSFPLLSPSYCLLLPPFPPLHVYLTVWNVSSVFRFIHKLPMLKQAPVSRDGYSYYYADAVTDFRVRCCRVSSFAPLLLAR